MKKLIKDLTQDDVKRICKKQIDKHQCCCALKDCCPLYSITSFESMQCLRIPEEIKKFNEDINKEVDVPDESKEDK